MSLALVSRKAALLAPWNKNELWRRARAVPSLDLRFADSKSLVDATTGQNLVTFTRASSGTYVGSDGLIKTATTNLLLRSEEFDNASWSVIGTASVSANADSSPTGAATADRLTVTTGGYIRQFVNGVIAGATYALSLWVKKPASGGATAIRVTSNNVNAWNTGITQKVTLTSSWQRITFAGTLVSSNTSAYLIIGGVDASGLNDADCVGDVLIWGAQLEQSSTVGEYIPTTSTINSAPRFDHNPTTGESLGLLVEEQRTNLLLRSEEFDNASWDLAAGTRSANAATAPTGTLTADKLIAATSPGTTGQLFQAVTITSGATVTGSLFVKDGGFDRLEIVLLSNNNTTPCGRATFNPISGAITTAASTANGGTNVSANVVAYTNGWYRLNVTVTYPAVTAAGMRILVFNSDGAVGDGTKGVFLWGAQLEAGAFPTSYIPTTTAAATRSADVASISGSNFSSWYNGLQGTMFASGFVEGRGAGSFSRLFALAGANAGTDEVSMYTRVNIDPGTNGRIFGAATVSSVLTGDVQPPNGASAGNYVSALAYKENDFALASNGLGPTTDTSGSLPTCEKLLIYGQARFQNMPYGSIKRFTYWPQRLANNVLQTITQ